MRRPLRFSIQFIFVLCLVDTAIAQGSRSTNSEYPPPTVTVSASGERVRFAAPSSVVQIRLEIYSYKGQKVFDNELRGGNVLDWHLRDGQAEPLPDAAYLCVVTVKSLSGRLTQAIGSVAVENGAASLQASTALQMTPQQAEAIGPVEENSALTVLKEDEQSATTVIAHNGEDGQITRGRGALSFRLGDFFSGKDTEQMRLTAEGNLGIGITHPVVKLDVDGLIRSTQGIVFPDGSVQFSASRRTYGIPSQKPGQFGKGSTAGQEHFEPQTTGAGTLNHLARWSDNVGTLGDSAIVDVNGDIGIGTTSPQSGLDYRNGFAAFFTRDLPTNPGNAISALQLGLSNVGSRNAGVGPSFLFFGENSAGNKSFLGRVSAVWENPAAGSEAGGIFFQVRANSADANALTERMRITAAGNVGIGTPSPLSKLTVFTPSNSYGLTHTNGTVTVGSFVDGIAGWFGTQSNHSLKFFTNNSASLMTITPADLNGNFAVGIGTPSPTTRLEVVHPATQIRFGPSGADNGGYLVSTNPSQAIIAGGASWNGTNWIAKDTVASLTAHQNGVIQFLTNSGLSVGSPFTPTERMKIDGNGNVMQSRDNGGLVKAMVYVNGDGTILRCYNGLTGSSSGNCGFTASHLFSGEYRVNFGFQVDDRFYSLAVNNDATPRIAAQFFILTSSTLQIKVFQADDSEILTDRPFMLIVY